MAAAQHEETIMSCLTGRHRSWLISTVALTMLTWTAALPAVASTPTRSNSAASSPCPGIPATQQLGTATPVLMVHGFDDSSSRFTSPGSLQGAIHSALGNAVAPLPFDYSGSSTKWVTDPAIGAQLAKCITWLADTSVQQKGPGRIIVVAHSMGGLAVRCALDPACAKVTRTGSAADPKLIGLVITLSTPNTGSNPQTLGPVADKICPQIPQCNAWLNLKDTPAARAMLPGSTELANLAPLPAQIPLVAIAGKISFTADLFGSVFNRLNSGLGGEWDGGDGIVPVSSALAEAQSSAGHDRPRAKSITVNCGSIPLKEITAWTAATAALRAPAPPVTCWHLTETTDPAWQADVVSAIQPVAKALSLMACTPAALTKGLLAANPQLNGYSWKLTLSACEVGWAVAEVYAPAVGYGTAFLRLTTSGWSSAPLGEVNCSVIPGPLAPPLPPHSRAVSLIDKAGICGSAGTSQPAGAPTGYDKYTNLRYGFTVLWPSSFRVQSPNNGDGHTWASPDGQVLLSAYGANNLSNYSPGQDEAIDARSMSIVYHNISGNVVTVSGYKNSGRTIVYQRDVVGPGAIDTLYWSYPASQKARWDAAVTLTGQTFQPGDVTTGH
jgi:pimeloyl-ACP methyl ester carboxylesterase